MEALTLNPAGKPRWGLALLASALLLVAVPAAATTETSTHRLDDLAAAVDARVAPGPREERALAKAASFLDDKSRTLGRDLRAAALAGAVLQRAFPGDAEFGDLLDEAVSGLRGDASDLRDVFAGLVDALGDSKKGRKARAVLRKADVALAAAEEEEGAVPALRSLGRAIRGIERRGRPLGLLGDSWIVAFVDGEPFVSNLSGSAHKFDGILWVDFWSAKSEKAAYYHGRFQTLYLRVPVYGPGSYLLGTEDYGSASSPLYDGQFGFHTGPSCSYEQRFCGDYYTYGGKYGTGLLTLTRLDEVVEGSFEFTASNFEQYVTVTGGRFHVHNP